MDEALFYKDFYKKYKDRGLEIVALCFEDPGYETSVKKMERFKRQTGAGYTFLYAGPRTRVNRDAVLYMLEGQVAYPTTIFFDRKGQIRKVETGFSGPGTGEHYRQFASETNGFVEQLLAE